jgi:hypothetical protein
MIRRAFATGVPVMSLIKMLARFSNMMQLENLNPLQGGILRMKHRSERRPGLPRESALVFYPRQIRDLFGKNWEVIKIVWWMLAVKRRIERDPSRFAYMDQALTPVHDDEDEKTFDYLNKTAGAKAAIDHLKKVHELTHAHVAAE